MIKSTSCEMLVLQLYIYLLSGHSDSLPLDIGGYDKMSFANIVSSLQYMNRMKEMLLAKIAILKDSSSSIKISEEREYQLSAHNTQSLLVYSFKFAQ